MSGQDYEKVHRAWAFHYNSVPCYEMVTFQYWTNGHIIPGLTVTSWSCWGLLFLFFPPTTPWYSMFTYIKLTKVANPHILETAITNLMHFASLMTTDGPNCGQLGLISCQADRLADSWLDKTDLCFINHSVITQCLVPSPAAQALLGMLSMHCCQRWSPAPQLL